MKTTFFALLLLMRLAASAQPFCGYPGDANNDGRANALDLLAVGLSYGAFFEPRPDPSTNWAPHCFEPWPQLLPFSMINAGFADANGNGKIDSLDIDAIVQNYDSIQTIPAFPPPMPYQPGPVMPPCALIRLEFRTDDVNPKKFYADVFFEADPTIFPGALGLAMRMTYPPAYIVEDSTRVLFYPDNNDLMGVGAAPFATSFQRQLPPGTVELAVAGRGNNALQSPRLVASVQFIVTQDVIIRNDTVDFALTVTNLLMINAAEFAVCTQVKTDSIRLIVPAAEPAAATTVKLWPNPARDRLRLALPDGRTPRRVQIRNAHGALVGAYEQTAEILLGPWPPGLYWVEIDTGNEWVWRRFLLLGSK